jgi:transposase
MEKQLEKAKKYDGVKTTKITKLKFLQNTTTTYSLNHKLLERTKILLGLKGYITNLNLSDKDIVDYYHNLFKIEAAFRIAKSDLEIRPIYHYKENTIKNHVLICFMCLAMSVYLELKNQKSIKVIVKALKAVTDGIILNTKTGQILQDRSEIKTPLLH